MHMVSQKDLDTAELETMRISKNPTTVMTANGEEQTREENNGTCQRIGLIRDSDCFLKKHPQFSFSGSSARILGIPTTGPAVENHNSHPKRQEK